MTLSPYDKAIAIIIASKLSKTDKAISIAHLNKETGLPELKTHREFRHFQKVFILLAASCEQEGLHSPTAVWAKELKAKLNAFEISD